MKNMITAIAICLCLFAAFQTLHADDVSLITERTAGNTFGSGARAMGMGGAHIASVLDGTALIYNPAGLAQIRRIEILGSITHQKFTNDVSRLPYFEPIAGFSDRGQNNTRLNGINISVPYPTYRGSLVFAFGLNRVKSFDKTFQAAYSFDFASVLATELETGSLYALSAGAGVDLSPKIAVGGSLNYYFGSDDYSWQVLSGESVSQLEPYIQDNIKDDYSAVSAKIGFMYSANDLLKFGVTVETPIQYNIEEDFHLRTYDDGDVDHDIGKASYDLLTPFSFGAGMAINLNRLQVATDINYTDWSQMEYKNNSSLETENSQISEYYRDVLRFSIGAEYLIPRIGLKIRGGYMLDPLPFLEKSLGDEHIPEAIGSPYDIIKDRKFFTFGFGYLIDRVMTLDVAVAIGGYKIKDNINLTTEDIGQTQVFVTTGFRL